MPLLCIPNVTSNHKHGIHWAWQILDDSHVDVGHAHEHPNDAAGVRASEKEAALQLALDTEIARAVAEGAPVLRNNDTPHAEEMLNLLSSWGTLPAHLIPLAAAWLVLMLVSVYLLQLPSYPAVPWNPPKPHFSF